MTPWNTLSAPQKLRRVGLYAAVFVGVCITTLSVMVIAAKSLPQ